MDRVSWAAGIAMLGDGADAASLFGKYVAYIERYGENRQVLFLGMSYGRKREECQDFAGGAGESLVLQALSMCKYVA
ncbi:hypothetical protein [Comamonas humi]